MSEVRTILERGLGGATPPPDPFERMLRRRDRKRRNQRVAAGVVGIAVFVAAIWIVSSGAPVDRGLTPAGTGPADTGPADTGPVVMPDYPGRVGLIGLAPEGLPPSTPARGELVLQFLFGHTGGDTGRFSLNLYADGRLIWEKLGEGYAGGDQTPTGFVEQRLSSEGVELIRSEMLSTGLFDRDLHLYGSDLRFGGAAVRDGDRLVNVTWSQEGATTAVTRAQADALKRLDARLESLNSWLPATAWVDQEMRPYVPARYAFCLDTGDGVGLHRVIASLPRQAEDMVRGWDLTYRAESFSFGWVWCSAVTADRARALAEVLDAAGVSSNGGDTYGLVYDSGPLNGSDVNVSISFDPAMPDWP